MINNNHLHNICTCGFAGKTLAGASGSDMQIMTESVQVRSRKKLRYTPPANTDSVLAITLVGATGKARAGITIASSADSFPALSMDAQVMRIPAPYTKAHFPMKRPLLTGETFAINNYGDEDLRIVFYYAKKKIF